jgi:hypothetical protein
MNTKKVVYFNIICCLLFYSCISFNKSRNPIDENCHITLFPDSTFKYENYEGHIPRLYEYSNGIWKKNNKNEIILNSYLKNKEIPVNVFRVFNSNAEKNHIEIQINAPKHNADIYLCLPHINGKPLLSMPHDTLSYLDSLLSGNNLYTMFQKRIKLFSNNEIIIQGQNALNKSVIGNDTVLTVPRGSYSLFIFIPIDSIKFEIVRRDSFFTWEEPINPILFTTTTKFNNILGEKITFDINIPDSLFRYKVFDNTQIRQKKRKFVISPYAASF